MLPIQSMLSLTAMAGMIASVTAISVNMYKSGDCNEYVTTFNPSYTNLGDNPPCYNFEYDGTNSQMITDFGGCGPYCLCTFYTNYNCPANQAQQSTHSIGQCISSGGGFKSASCTKFQKPLW